ncbi:hypothetical protein BDN67DRAFT_981649 [Paxillus ammoniavirescens]|nr:hypothetical protein BDN67DRAFT_981649 [Paxillus ammoniavirescens]
MWGGGGGLVERARLPMIGIKLESTSFWRRTCRDTRAYQRHHLKVLGGDHTLHSAPLSPKSLTAVYENLDRYVRRVKILSSSDPRDCPTSAPHKRRRFPVGQPEGEAADLPLAQAAAKLNLLKLLALFWQGGGAVDDTSATVRGPDEGHLHPCQLLATISHSPRLACPFCETRK